MNPIFICLNKYNSLLIRRQIWKKLNEVKGPAIEHADADYPETAGEEEADSSQTLSS